MAETVGDFVAFLGLKLDQRAWSLGDRFINNLKNKVADFQTWARGVSWFSGLISGVADLGDALDEASQKTGVSVEELQEYGYAAGQAGVSQDSLNNALGKLAINLDKANHGGKEQAKTFARMGIATKDAEGKTRAAGDVFLDIADHFASIEDPAERARLASDVFGRGIGKDLIPVLGQGRGRLEELRQEFRDTGAEIDGPTAEAFGTLNDQKDLLATGWKGIKTQLAVALLPTLLQLVRAFNAWIKANRGMIRQKIEVVAKVIAASLKIVAKAILLVLDGLTFLNDHWDKAKFFIYALVAALAVYEAATIAAGIASAISWLVGLWPLGLLLLAIGAVILIIEDLYTYFTGGESVFGTFLDAVEQYIGIDAVGIVQDAVDFIIASFQIWWDYMNLLFAFVSAQFSVLKTGAEILWKIVKPIVDGIREAVGYVDKVTNSSLNPFGGNFAGTGTRIVPGKAEEAQRTLEKQFITAPVSLGNAGAFRAQSAGGTQVANNLKAEIHINAPGGDPDAVGKATHHAMQEFWDTKVRTILGGEEE